VIVKRINVLFAALLFAAALVPGALHAQTTAPAGDAKHGAIVFESNGCYLCHNYQGQAGGGRPGTNPGPNLAPAPIVYSAFLRQVRVPRRSMPPYDAKILSDRDIADMYAFLLAQPPSKDPRTIALLNAVTSGSGGTVPRGAVVYAANCASCHGASGQGGIGPALKKEGSRKDTAAVAAFVKNPPGPMPRLYPGLLTDGDLAAVADFVNTLK
jgi:ubiquinol-cytochrome c reductase cytochrome c subunit